MKQLPPVNGRQDLKAIQASRLWHLSSHRHTGRVLPKRSTSYPILAMLLLCTGIFVAAWSHIVTADSDSSTYTVHASVPGPPPTEPAIISSPVDGAVFDSSDVPITVSGSCPMNSYVDVYRNNFFSGVVICDPSGSWSLQTDLFNGNNDIQARVFSFTDQAGPIDPASNVTVTYNAPVVVTPPVTSEPSPGSSSSASSDSSDQSSQSSPSLPTPSTDQNSGTISNPSPSMAEKSDALPPTIAASFAYLGVYAGATFTEHLDLEGGTAPYALNINWGDGDQQLVSRPNPGAFAISHIYKKAGGFHGSYTIKIAITDALGNQSFLQLLSIVNSHDEVNGGITGSGTSSGSRVGQVLNSITSGNYREVLRYVWPSYGVVVLMLLSFWLGERQEFHYLKPRLRRSRIRHTH